MTRLAKAMSAFNFGRSGSADGCDAVALATRGASLDAKGTSAPSAAAHATATPSRRLHSALLAGLGVTALLALTVAPAAAAPTPGDPCPNGDLREAQSMSHLPDCMALEQVSPQFKDNQPARIRFVENANTVNVHAGSISADGERVRFRSTGSLAGTPSNLDAFGSWYIASRDQGNESWETFHTSPPAGMTMGWLGFNPSAQPTAFDPDLSHWFQIAGTPEQYEAGHGQPMRGTLGEESTFLSPLLMRLSGAPGGGFPGIPEFVDYRPRGSSADGSHLYITTTEPLTFLPGDPLPSPSAFQNTYVAQLASNGDPSLELLARDGNGKTWGNSCGAQLGGGHPESAPNRNRGAISADGARTYFSTRPSQPASGNCDMANKLRILKRFETAEGPWISELITSECDRVANPPTIPSCGTADSFGFPLPIPDGDDAYQGASIEGSRVYFTTTRQLADTDVNGFASDGFSSSCVGFFGSGIGGCDLYLFDAGKPVGQRLTQITAGSSGQSVPSVAAISGDGSHAYFTSTEVLTSNSGHGTPDTAQLGQTNLYVYDAEDDELSFITITNPGSAYPVPVLGDDPTELGVGGDGHLLVFTSNAALTPDDLDGSKSDVFRYDAEDGSLTRISKAAPGGAGDGPFDVFAGNPLGSPAGHGRSGSPEFVVQGRWVSEDGETISFRTQDALVPGDENGVLDSYLYRDGQPQRLPGTGDSTNGLHNVQGLQDGPLVSTDGDLVAFQSFQQLLPRDRDTGIDVYALRVDGGFPEPPVPAVCQPDSKGGCQGTAGDPPGTGGGASATLVGPGNVKEAGPRTCGRAKIRRGNRCIFKRKLAKRACAKRKGKAKRRCVRKQVRRLNRIQQRQNRANANRGAGK